MNERIKELEIQCWEPRQYGPAWFNSTKFAELIVRECMEQLNITNVPTPISAGLNLGKVAIKEHFEVEE